MFKFIFFLFSTTHALFQFDANTNNWKFTLVPFKIDEADRSCMIVGRNLPINGDGKIDFDETTKIGSLEGIIFKSDSVQFIETKRYLVIVNIRIMGYTFYDLRFGPIFRQSGLNQVMDITEMISVQKGDGFYLNIGTNLVPVYFGLGDPKVTSLKISFISV
jgi:hypothetical protein